MNQLAKFLAAQVAILEDLDRQRIDTRTPEWGRDVEFDIITRELCILEQDIERDPGELARFLVRARRPKKEA